jgi:hypothetical protein
MLLQTRREPQTDSSIFAEFFSQGGLTSSQHITMAQSSGRRLTSWSRLMLAHKMRFPREDRCVRLVAVTPRQFGFTNRLDVPLFMLLAMRQGLRRCWPDAATNLCRLYQGQPLGEVMYVATRIISDAGGGKQVLSLSSRKNGLWLSEFRWHHDIAGLLSVDSLWLFEQP